MEDIAFSERIQLAAVQFLPFLAAVVFHEYGHGLMAKFWGDKTAEEEGRLTLDFTKHIHPVGTVLFPLINMIFGINLLIGWAKPVPIDPRRFRKLRPGLFFVAFAGPLMNFILAAISAFVFIALSIYMPDSSPYKEPLAMMAQTSVFLNYALGLFNLLPIPPLDGGKIVESFLPPHLAVRFEQSSKFAMFLLVALLLSGAFQLLSIPITFLGRGTLELAARAFGLPLGI